jgi:lysophospholipase L1-like esterase
VQPATPPAIVSPAPSPPAASRPPCVPPVTLSPAPSPPAPGTAAPEPSPSALPGRGGPAVPEPRPWATAAWLQQHDAFLARACEGPIDVVFLGDSIAAFFPTRGADAWSSEIAPLGDVADFGIVGDRTQFVLWRVLHGELDPTGARAVVLMVGTNNLAAAPPAAVASGIAAIVAAVRARLPDAVVIVEAILPRGAPGNPLREKAAAVNARVAALADGVHVRWLDVGPQFLAPDGTIPPGLMPDGLHPSEAGYEIWAAALAPLLREVLGK